MKYRVVELELKVQLSLEINESSNHKNARVEIMHFFRIEIHSGGWLER